MASLSLCLVWIPWMIIRIFKPGQCFFDVCHKQWVMTCTLLPRNPTTGSKFMHDWSCIIVMEFVKVLIEWFMVHSWMAIESQPNTASRCGVYPQKSARNYRLQTLILLIEVSLIGEIDMFSCHMHVHWTYLNKCFSVPGGTAPLTHLMSGGAVQRWDTSAVTLLQDKEVLAPTPEAAKGGGEANLTTLPHLISSLSPPICCKWTQLTLKQNYSQLK